MPIQFSIVVRELRCLKEEAAIQASDSSLIPQSNQGGAMVKRVEVIMLSGGSRFGQYKTQLLLARLSSA